MTSLLPFLLPMLGILFLIIRRASKSAPSHMERPDFIAKASESRFVTSDPNAFVILSNPSDYNYDVVGESFQSPGEWSADGDDNFVHLDNLEDNI